MSNFQVSAPLVNGDLMPVVDRGGSAKEFLEHVIGPDLRPPPRHLVIEVTTATGKYVRLVFPNDSSDAVVFLDGERL